MKNQVDRSALRCLSLDRDQVITHRRGPELHTRHEPQPASEGDNGEVAKFKHSGPTGGVSREEIRSANLVEDVNRRSTRNQSDALLYTDEVIDKQVFMNQHQDDARVGHVTNAPHELTTSRSLGKLSD